MVFDHRAGDLCGITILIYRGWIMTRKDYIAIADTIVSTRIYNSDNYPKFKTELLRMFYSDNSDFDGDKFEQYINKKILQQKEENNES